MRLFSLFLLIILNSGYLPAAADGVADSVKEVSQNTPDITDVPASVINVITSPLRWKDSDLITAGGFLALSTASFLLDDEVRDLMLKNNSSFNDKIEPIGYTYGAPQYAAPAAITVYLAGLVSGNEKIEETGLMLTESLISVALIQIPARLIAGRARPETGEKNTSFDLFNGVGQERSSFISGHSAIAFAFSTVLAHQIDHPAATAALYLLAASTPYSRMYLDKHWFSDALIGSMLGYFIGRTVIKFHEDYKDDNLSLYPTVNGLGICYNF